MKLLCFLIIINLGMLAFSLLVLIINMIDLRLYMIIVFVSKV